MDRGVGGGGGGGCGRSCTIQAVFNQWTIRILEDELKGSNPGVTLLYFIYSSPR